MDQCVKRLFEVNCKDISNHVKSITLPSRWHQETIHWSVLSWLWWFSHGDAILVLPCWFAGLNFKCPQNTPRFRHWNEHNLSRYGYLCYYVLMHVISYKETYVIYHSISYSYHIRRYFIDGPSVVHSRGRWSDTNIQTLNLWRWNLSDSNIYDITFIMSIDSRYQWIINYHILSDN